MKNTANAGRTSSGLLQTAGSTTPCNHKDTRDAPKKGEGEIHATTGTPNCPGSVAKRPLSPHEQLNHHTLRLTSPTDTTVTPRALSFKAPRGTPVLVQMSRGAPSTWADCNGLSLSRIPAAAPAHREEGFKRHFQNSTEHIQTLCGFEMFVLLFYLYLLSNKNTKEKHTNNNIGRIVLQGKHTNRMKK